MSERACPTIERLAALRPGERFRYWSDAPSTRGPACSALMARIDGFARNLWRDGRVTLSTESYAVAPARNDRKIEIVEYFATGKELPHAGE